MMQPNLEIGLLRLKAENSLLLNLAESRRVGWEGAIQIQETLEAKAERLQAAGDKLANALQVMLDLKEMTRAEFAGEYDQRPTWHEWAGLARAALREWKVVSNGEN